MKKLVSMLLVVALLCGCGLVVYGSAAESETYLNVSAHIECLAENIYPGARMTIYADFFTDGALPTGTTLKFQWYKNNVNSNEGGTKIELSEGNSQGIVYIPNTSKVGTTYYYVIITETPSSGEPVLYKSPPVEITVKANPSTHPVANILTPAEESGWMISTLSKDIIDLCKTYAAASDGRIKVSSTGYTTLQGRDIPLIIFGIPAPDSPEDVPEDKAIVLLNANIHSGEIEGKESMLIFAREVAMGMHDDLLKNVVVLSTININPDGNDTLGNNRNNTQYTPTKVGLRTNGAGGTGYYNINRDMTKLDTAEARALISVMNIWDPIAYVDQHGTNGTLQRHFMETHSGLHPDEYAPLALYNRDEFTDIALGPKSYFLEATGLVTAPYGDFSSNGYRDGGTWTVGSQEYPRFTTNYVGMRNRISVLFESYSHASYTERVDIQYYGVLSFLKAVDKEKDTIKRLIGEADALALSRATKGINPETDLVTLTTVRTILDRGDGKNGTLTIKSYEANANGGAITYILRDADNLRSGTVFAGLKEYQNVIHNGHYEPVTQVQMGAYYLIEQDCTEAIEVLQSHGIEMAQLAEPITLNAGEYQWYDAVTRTRSTTENHSMNQLGGEWKTTANKQVFPAGTYVVSPAQVRGNLAAYMLEPASPDGIVAWNMVDKQMVDYAGTVRANYVSSPATGGDIAIPVFKIADFEILDLNPTLKLTTAAHLVQAGDYFTLNASFTETKSSNVAVLNYTFDGNLFEYAGFTPAQGVGVVDVEFSDGHAKVTVMKESYDIDNLGDIMLRAKENAPLKLGYQGVSLSAAYVVKDEAGDKAIETAQTSVLFTTFGTGEDGEPIVKGDTDNNGVVDLLDLSNMIDWFGIINLDPNWSNKYTYFDFNNNGEIDITDISYVAKLIK